MTKQSYMKYLIKYLYSVLPERAKESVYIKGTLIKLRHILKEIEDEKEK